MAVGGELPGEDIAPEPGAAARVLPGGQGAAARLRVHGQGQPREPPLQKEWIRPTHLLGPEATDRHRRRTRPRLPALVGEARHLPRLQGLKHPPRHALQRQALRLWARESRADRRRQPRDHPRDGHLRVRGAGVRGDGPPVREERRVRVRRGAAGDADGAAGARHVPAGAAAEPGGLGQAAAGGPAEACPARGPAAGGAVPVQGRPARRAAHAELPRRRPQEAALHGRGRRGAGGDRAHAAAAPARVAGRRWEQQVAEGRGAERARREQAPAAVAAAEVLRVGRRAEQPPFFSSEMTPPAPKTPGVDTLVVRLCARFLFGPVFLVLGFSSWDVSVAVDAKAHGFSSWEERRVDSTGPDVAGCSFSSLSLNHFFLRAHAPVLASAHTHCTHAHAFFFLSVLAF